MPNDAALEANERSRWGYLSDRKLRTRLRRIKKPEKLAWFMRLAMENGKADLFNAALVRAADLGVGHFFAIRRIAQEQEFRTQDDTFTSGTRTRERQWEANLRTVDISGAEAVMEVEVKTVLEKPAVRKIRF